MEGESESRGSPLGINNFSQFCGLYLRVPLPLYFFFSDRNFSLSNPEPKTSPRSFSVFLFIVAFRPCGCSGVPLITSSWKHQPLSCVCKLFHSALCLGRCESALDRAACPWRHWKQGSKPWYFVVWKQSWPRYGPKGEDGAKHWELQVKKARKKTTTCQAGSSWRKQTTLLDLWSGNKWSQLVINEWTWMFWMSWCSFFLCFLLIHYLCSRLCDVSQSASFDFKKK